MKFNNVLFIIATIVVMTCAAPLAVNASSDFLGYKCGEGNYPIAYQHNKCPNGVIEHKVILIGNLVKLIDSIEIGTEETVSWQKITANNRAVRKASDKEIARLNFEKEQADKQREAEIIAANERANAQAQAQAQAQEQAQEQAQAQANQVELLNKINKKLNIMRTQNIIDKNQQQQYNREQEWNQRRRDNFLVSRGY